MAQTNITIRLDEDVKRGAEALFIDMGLNMSVAINMFFRQVILEKAIPFPIKAKTVEEAKYNEYFNPYNAKILMESIAQAERGEVITFSMAELEAMESGAIPQRAVDFLEAHKR